MRAQAASPRLLRAIQQIVDEEIAKPVLLGRPEEIKRLCEEMSLDMLDRVQIIDPRAEVHQGYADRLYELRQRKGMTLDNARAFVQRGDYYAAVMVDRGDADGMVTGFRLNYPETVKPVLEVLLR